MAVTLDSLFAAGELVAADSSPLLDSLFQAGELVAKDPATVKLTTTFSAGEALAPDAPISGSVAADVAPPSMAATGYEGTAAWFADIPAPAVDIGGTVAHGDLSVSALAAVEFSGAGSSSAGSLTATITPTMQAAGAQFGLMVQVSAPSVEAVGGNIGGMAAAVPAPAVDMLVRVGAVGGVGAEPPAPVVVVRGAFDVALDPPAPVLAMAGEAGAAGQVSAALPAPVVLIDADGAITGTLALALAAPLGEFLGEHSAMGGIWIAAPVPAVDASIVVGSIGTVLVSVPAYEFSAEAIHVYGSVSVRMPAVLVEFGGGASPVAATYSVHAVNLINGGVTDFVFAKQVSEAVGLGDGRVLFVGPDGAFLMEGDTDDGVAIGGSLQLAPSSEGSSARKRPVRAFVSLRGGGGMFNVQTQDGTLYSYPVEATGESGVHVERAKLGRGLDSAYCGFGYASDEPFQIDRIEVELEEKKVRVR